MQADATTLEIVGLTKLGVVASVLTVVCKRMQQLQLMLGPAVHHGKDTTHKTLETMCNARAWPHVGRAVQTDPTLLRYASAITEQTKGWKLLAQKFDRFQTLRNNSQQHATTCNRV